MSDEIVFDVLCTKVLDALRALGLGKFSIRNYYYEGMWPIIKVYRSEGVILYSAAFTNEIVDRFRLEHENGLVCQNQRQRILRRLLCLLHHPRQRFGNDEEP